MPGSRGIGNKYTCFDYKNKSNTRDDVRSTQRANFHLLLDPSARRRSPACLNPASMRSRISGCGICITTSRGCPLFSPRRDPMKDVNNLGVIAASRDRFHARLLHELMKPSDGSVSLVETVTTPDLTRRGVMNSSSRRANLPKPYLH